MTPPHDKVLLSQRQEYDPYGGRVSLSSVLQKYLRKQIVIPWSVVATMLKLIHTTRENFNPLAISDAVEIDTTRSQLANNS